MPAVAMGQMTLEKKSRKRPPRYALRRIGALYSSGCMPVCTSRVAASPNSAAVTMKTTTALARAVDSSQLEA